MEKMHMTDNEMRAFLQQIADKMNTNFHIDMTNSFADALKAMAENANAVLKSINLDAPLYIVNDFRCIIEPSKRC